MVIGIFLLVVGYSIFYWGWHRFIADCPPGDKNCWPRYPLMCVLGLGNIGLPTIKGFQWETPNLPGSASTGGGTQQQTPSNSTTPGPLKGGGVNPIGPGWTMGRTDQGVDWSGSGDLYAISDGTIVNVYNSGWPGGTFIVLKLDNPPAGLPSPDIYYAEDIIPNVQVGQHVKKGDVIGTGSGGPSGIELGFADPNAIGSALAHGASGATSLGQQFKSWISNIGGL